MRQGFGGRAQPRSILQQSAPPDVEGCAHAGRPQQQQRQEAAAGTRRRVFGGVDPPPGAHTRATSARGDAADGGGAGARVAPAERKWGSPAACTHTQLYASGERERLKRLLTERLTDCGWKENVKELCRGAGDGVLSRAAPTRCASHLRAPHLPLLLRCAPPAEYVQKHGRENVTTEQVVAAVRPAGRQTVPDAVKAQLLAEIKKFILQL